MRMSGVRRTGIYMKDYFLSRIFIYSRTKSYSKTDQTVSQLARETTMRTNHGRQSPFWAAHLSPIFYPTVSSIHFLGTIAEKVPRPRQVRQSVIPKPETLRVFHLQRR